MIVTSSLCADGPSSSRDAQCRQEKGHRNRGAVCFIEEVEIKDRDSGNNQKGSEDSGQDSNGVLMTHFKGSVPSLIRR